MLDKVRSFVSSQLIGHERVLDSPSELPLGLYEELVSAGLANWWLPQRLGGAGLSLADSVDIVAELAYGDAGLAFAFFLPILGTTALELYGTEAQQRLYLGEMARAGGFCATVASEREAGSELVRTATAARGAGASWRIDGEKYFSTNAEIADFFVVYARLAGRDDAFGAFVVPRDAPGLSIVRRWPTIGVRAAGTYELALRDCPSDALLGGNGLRILEVGLNASRTLMAASALGVGRRVRDLCLAYAEDKALKGGRLIDNPVFAAKLGQIQIDLDVMAAVCRAAARDFDELRARADAPEAFLRTGCLRSVLVAKVTCGQLGWRIAGMGSEMLGGLGYTEDSLMGKLVRDMRYVSIVEGGDDVLRDLMYARHVMPAFAEFRAAAGSKTPS